MATFTDAYGETVTGSPETGWARGGTSLGPCEADQARGVFDGMTPDGYVPPVAPIPVPTSISPLDFMARLTNAEQGAIATAAQSNAVILLWMLKLSGASTVETTDALTIAGMQAMEQAGLIGAGRAVIIMNLGVASP